MNVLIALSDSNHVFHERAWSWFDDKKKSGWATCPLTENGLVRIISNPSYPNRLDSVLDAVEILKKITLVEGHRFIPCDISFSNFKLFENLSQFSGKHLTDVYLLGLSISYKIHFATFDKNIPFLAVKNGMNFLEIIEK